MMRTRTIIALLALMTGMASLSAAPGSAQDPAPGVTTVTQHNTKSFRVNFADGAVLDVRIAPAPKGPEYRLKTPDGSYVGGWSKLPGLADRDCGGLKVRAASLGVAITALCDVGTYYEDQAPAGSKAIFSSDTGKTWQHAPLKGEAYEEPGISANGANAVWPIHGGRYLEYQSGAGFQERTVSARGEEYTVTATITDSGQVDYLFGAPADKGACVLQVRRRIGDGPVAATAVKVDDACSDTALENVDANTVRLHSGLGRILVTRTAPDAPWVVTSGRPNERPELVVRGPRAFAETDAGGMAVGVVNSPQGATVGSQSYSEATDSWSSPQTILAKPDGRCQWRYPVWSPLNTGTTVSVRVFTMACRTTANSSGVRRSRSWVFVSTNDATFTADRVGLGAAGFSSRSRYYVVPRRHDTLIFSLSHGRVRVPSGVDSKCDLVSASSPTSLVMIDNNDARKHPFRLRAASTTQGWQTLRTLPWTGPRGCSQATNFTEGARDRFVLRGSLNGRKRGQMVLALWRAADSDAGWRWAIQRGPIFYF